jgi:hypothetical protein
MCSPLGRYCDVPEAGVTFLGRVDLADVGPLGTNGSGRWYVARQLIADTRGGSAITRYCAISSSTKASRGSVQDPAH